MSGTAKVCPCMKAENCLLHNASMRLERIEGKIITAIALISEGFGELKEWAGELRRHTVIMPDGREG